MKQANFGVVPEHKLGASVLKSIRYDTGACIRYWDELCISITVRRSVV
jgi:hypothetical protein